MFTDIVGYLGLSAKDANKVLKLIDKQKQLLIPILGRVKEGVLLSPFYTFFIPLRFIPFLLICLKAR
jgi:hypothetical protein